MDAWMFGIGAALALQGLQTIQIAIVGRRVDTVAKSLQPPPMPPTCMRCGLPFMRDELSKRRLCRDCEHALDAAPTR
jgi:hypothetical protein